jgi:anti-sigma-K factor RskA
MSDTRDKDARIRDLLAERALLELSAAEQIELRGLLAESSIDPESFERVAAAAAVALNPGPYEPLPADLKARIASAAPGHLAAAERLAPDHTSDATRFPRLTPGSSAVPSGARRFRERLAWLVAAASVLFAISTWWFARSIPATLPSLAEQRSQLLEQAPDAQQFDWTATADPAAQGATGDVVWSNREQKGYMRFKGLAKNDPETNQYQLWIFDSKQDERYPIDGGVFDIDLATGDVIVPIHAALRVVEPQLFAVTVEKPGGVVVSSRERIALTAKPPI